MKRLIHGSLFAGIGGFDLGFERAGFDTKWQVENDKFCNKVLERHFPQAKRYGDITKLNPAELEWVDVITGGFPCQDLSVAGKRKGLKGERSGLFFELKRIVKALRPAWIVVENVPGLLSSNRGRDFGLALFHLEECGYGLAWRILDSRYFGVAQRRRRVFIVGCFGKPCPPEILFEPEGVCLDFKAKRKAGGEVARSVGTSTQRWKPDQETFITGTLQGGGKRGYRVSTEGVRDGQIFVAPIKAHPPSQRKGGSRPIVGEFIIEQNNACSTPELPSQRAHGTPNYAVAYQLRANPSKADKPTSTTYVGAPTDPDRVRTAPRFSRRMDTPDGSRYRALGNAVTVNVAEWIAKRIMHFPPTATGKKGAE